MSGVEFLNINFIYFSDVLIDTSKCKCCLIKKNCNNNNNNSLPIDPAHRDYCPFGIILIATTSLWLLLFNAYFYKNCLICRKIGEFVWWVMSCACTLWSKSSEILILHHYINFIHLVRLALEVGRDPCFPVVPLEGLTLTPDF